MVPPIRMDNSSEGSKLPSLLTSLIKTGNYSKAQAFRLLFNHLGALITGARRPHLDSDGAGREYLCAVYGE
jgi:hypothetical protein